LSSGRASARRRCSTSKHSDALPVTAGYGTGG
jgi:hypothetical protein